MQWSVLGESVAGTSHAAGGTPCQDAFRFRTIGIGAKKLAIVAADGAGSASHSEAGATLVCDEIIRRLEAESTDDPMTREQMLDLLANVRAILIREAQLLNVAPRELACTVLIAITGPDRATFAQIGDGTIVIREEDRLETVFWPEPTEYVNTTDFLTDDWYADRLQFATRESSICEMAVMTDGLQRLALDFAAHKPHDGFFQPFFDALRANGDPEALSNPFRQFLDSARVNERTDDDKTLIVAVRLP